MRRRRAKPSARNRLPELRQAALVNRHDARVPQPPRQLDFSAKALAGFNRKIATLMRARLHLRVGPLAVLQSIVILGGRTRSAPLPGSSNAWSPPGMDAPPMGVRDQYLPEIRGDGRPDAYPVGKPHSISAERDQTLGCRGKASHTDQERRQSSASLSPHQKR